MKKDNNMLRGYMLVDRKTGAVLLAPNQPSIWPTEKGAEEFARKYSIFKSWKPILVSVFFHPKKNPTSLKKK